MDGRPEKRHAAELSSHPLAGGRGVRVIPRTGDLSVRGWGTPQRLLAATMMSVGARWRVRWDAAQRRMAAAPYAPAVTAAALALLAAVQAATQAATIGSASPGDGPVELAAVLLSLITTLPLALLRSYPGAVAVSIAAANAV